MKCRPTFWTSLFWRLYTVTLLTCLNCRISDAVQKCQKTDVLQKCHKTDTFQKCHNIDARKNCRNSDEMWSEILNVTLPTFFCCSSDVSRTVAISTDVTRPKKMEIVQNVRRATLTGKVKGKLSGWLWAIDLGKPSLYRHLEKSLAIPTLRKSVAIVKVRHYCKSVTRPTLSKSVTISMPGRTVAIPMKCGPKFWMSRFRRFSVALPTFLELSQYWRTSQDRRKWKSFKISEERRLQGVGIPTAVSI